MSRIRVRFTVLVVLVFSIPQVLSAQPFVDHLVELDELRADLSAQSAQRQANIAEVRRLLRHDLVQKQVGQLVDLQRIDAGIESLDDEILAQLAEQSRAFDDQLGAGVSSWVIIIGVAGALLVILLLI